MAKFNFNRDFSRIDFKKHPELYQIGRGEQGIMMVEPYSSTILKHWRFKTPEIAKKSAAKIYSMFLAYLRKEEFVGADMCRKALAMGWTRSLRYSSSPDGSGRRKDDKGNKLKQDPDWNSTAYYKSSQIFKKYFDLARKNKTYLKLKQEHRKNYDDKAPTTKEGQAYPGKYRYTGIDSTTDN